ncbi:hypothetical protein Efla_003523 [Eimeria flavescens]
MTAPPRRALITGITGQDGSYLSELLLEKGYEVHGLIRRCSTVNTERLLSFSGRLQLHHGDMADGSSLFRVLSRVRPHEIYNLAAQSHVKVSFDMPEYTTDSTALGVLRLLEAVRAAGLEKETRLFQASSSEMFGCSQAAVQNEVTPFSPCSPYGISKLYGHFTVQTYRAAFGMFCVSGILFNHESPRRGASFVSRKVTQGVAKIVKGELSCLELGNLDARRDWGHARDYVEAMWRMLQQEQPRDFVQHSVREFCELAFALVSLPLEWEGEGLSEVGRSGDRVLVRVAEAHMRPTDVEALKGDAAAICRELSWSPSTAFSELVVEMLVSDMRLEGLEPPSEAECSERLKAANRSFQQQQKQQQGAVSRREARDRSGGGPQPFQLREQRQQAALVKATWQRQPMRAPSGTTKNHMDSGGPLPEALIGGPSLLKVPPGNPWWGPLFGGPVEGPPSGTLPQVPS